MARVVTTIDAVRERFSALRQPLAFFDGPGGTQVPDTVIDAISHYLRESNANIGAPYGTSRRTDALVAEAHETAAEFLNATPAEVAFGPNMTTLNFALTRSAGREWAPGDEIVCTKLDHDANVSPWLELARDRELVVKFAEIDGECRIDLDHLRSLLSERTRVVAYPYASNAVGTITPVAEIAEIAHGAGALAWVDAVHYGPHGPIDVQELGADVLVCSPYKYYGPHMGLAFGRADLLESWRPYKVRPSANEPVGRRFETGTSQHELLAGFVAAVEHMKWVGWDFILDHEAQLGEQFLAGLPDNCGLYGPATMDERVSTFAFNVDGHTPEQVATHLGDRGYAVWHGNYYAVEIMNRLGLPDGAVRVGIVHYNTAEEVAGLLAALDELR